MSSGLVARAAAVSAVLAALGSAFGLARDLLVGALFGADRETDAFFVAWTVPETVAPLLIEGTMAMVMVPAFGRALAAAEAGGTEPGLPDPGRDLVEATLLRIVALLSVVGVLVAVFAPALITVFAPGLPDPELAATCMRAVAPTVPLFGVAGYLAAGLRTYGRFTPPAAIYLAYNVGIIAAIAVTHSTLGVVGAAIGISVGAALMVGVQLPAALRVMPWPRTWSLRRTSALLAIGAFLPVAGHTLARQAQTFVERFAASGLAEGTISHLNYAQKIAQIPITLSFMAAAVTFPIFAKNVAAGSLGDARRRMETDLVGLGAIALLVTAYLTLYAPDVVAVLFQRGAFTAADTAAAAAVLRVYVLGILGQTVVSLLVRPFFTYQGAVWFPAVAMAWGLGVTAVGTAVLVAPFGAPGIAASNALGITTTAVILAAGARNRLSTAPTAAAYGRLAALLLPLALAVAAGLLAARLTAGTPAFVVAGAGGVVMVAVFAAPFVIRWRLRKPIPDEEHSA